MGADTPTASHQHHHHHSTIAIAIAITIHPGYMPLLLPETTSPGTWRVLARSTVWSIAAHCCSSLQPSLLAVVVFVFCRVKAAHVLSKPGWKCIPRATSRWGFTIDLIICACFDLSRSATRDG